MEATLVLQGRQRDEGGEEARVMPRVHGQNPSDCGNLNQEVRLRKSSHTQPCPGSGERQGWRGGKGHDVHTGMTHSIVARQECDISVSNLYKWALRVVNRQGV